MPRYYKRKTEIQPGASENMKRAVEDVMNNQGSLRGVAERHGVKKSSLANYVAKARSGGVDSTVYQPNYKKAQVFSPAMEDLLVKYLITCQKMFHGLTPAKVRSLAFQFGKANA